MPYVDSIGMPAGYTNNSPYGPLQAEDLYANPVLQEEPLNPVADGNMFPASPVFDAPQQQMVPQQQMPPEMMGQVPPEMMMQQMPPEMMMGGGAPGLPSGQQMTPEAMGDMGPEQGLIQQEGMSPQDAGALLRERLLRRQQRLSETSVQFTDNAHQLNR